VKQCPNHPGGAPAVSHGRVAIIYDLYTLRTRPDRPPWCSWPFRQSIQEREAVALTVRRDRASLPLTVLAMTWPSDDHGASDAAFTRLGPGGETP